MCINRAFTAHTLPRRGRTPSGLSLVEVLLAAAIGAMVLGILALLVSGSMKSFAWASVSEQVHAQFLGLRNQFSRDVQQASAVVEAVTLDEVTYRTLGEPPAESLVLQLPAMDAQGNLLLGTYDFAVYTVQRTDDDGTASLRRRLFTTRAPNGNPLVGVAPSGRLPEDRVLLRNLQVPPPGAAATPMFLFHPVVDPPVVPLAEEVEMSIALQITDSASNHRTALQRYSARFRLRNRS